LQNFFEILIQKLIINIACFINIYQNFVIFE